MDKMEKIENEMNTDITDAKRIKEIQKELSELVQTDKKEWIKMYQLMAEVQDKKLYLNAGCKSFTNWVNTISVSYKIHVSLLWERFKAGKSYEEFSKKVAQSGGTVKSINDLKVPSGSMVFIEKISGRNTAVMSDLIEKCEAGNMSRQDLRNAWQIKKRENEKQKIFSPKNAYDKNYDNNNNNNNNNNDDDKLTASEVVFALQQNYSSWCGTNIREKKYDSYDIMNIKKDRFWLLSEFAIKTGTSKKARRIDALAIENFTTTQGDLTLHAVEIKVDKNDLLNDEKMAEYVDFCDKFYLAIPGDLIEVAEEYALDDWGILIIKKEKRNYSVEVFREAKLNAGVFRDKSLETALLKLA